MAQREWFVLRAELAKLTSEKLDVSPPLMANTVFRLSVRSILTYFVIKQMLVGLKNTVTYNIHFLKF